jgi:ATP-binding cassette subfamily F protein 3
VLVGPNGDGKSTLLKLIAGVLQHQSGERVLGYNVTLGYFAQYRMDVLNPKHTVLQSAMDMPDPVPEIAARTLLGSFLFRGEDVFKPVGILSGGEKTRLALVKLLLDPPNFLLMDEPTTHLDMGSIDALIGALEHYEGTLVFISHDVHFIRSISKTVLHIDAGVVTPYAGDYQYFLDKTKANSAKDAITASLTNHQPESTGGSNGGGKSPVFRSKEQKRLEAQARQQRSDRKKALNIRIGEIESTLAVKEKRNAELVIRLQDSAIWNDTNKAQAVQKEHDDLDRTILTLTQEWEAKTAELEELTGGPAEA